MKATLKKELPLAMKAKDKVKVDTIRGLLSAIQYEEIQKGTEDLPADSIIAILKSELKKRKESKEFAEQAKRADESAQIDAEILVIESFLPKQLSAEELEKIIVGLKTSTPGINMGAAMKVLKDNYSGQYDGKIASEVAKKVLA